MEKEKKNKRVFIMGWPNDRQAFVDAVKELQKRNYQILYWAVPNKQAIADMKKDFPLTQFHAHDDAINLIAPDEIDENEFAPPGQELIEKFFELESTLLAMKKFCFISRSALEKKHLFHRLIRYWHGVIEKFKPEAIFFVVWPHSVYDFTVYFLAKALNIKTVMFENTGVADRYLLVTDIKRGGLALKQEIIKNQDGKFKLEDLSPDIRNYYNWHINNRTGEVIPILKTEIKDYQGINWLKIKFKIFIKSIKNLSLFSKLADYILRRFRLNLKKEYEAAQTDPDLNIKYIYLPLSYQPEASTCPLGGIFVDQLEMIKILSYCLPADWQIYVKEHPMQWLHSNLDYSDFRFKNFYTEIANTKNVKIVPLKTNSHELIANAQAVATVTGTAGAEAIMRLKPVLLFGYISYRDCPAVFKIKNIQDCGQALEKIKDGFKFSDQQLINYLYSLDKASYHLNFEITSKRYSKATEEEVTKTIVEVMAGEAENN